MRVRLLALAVAAAMTAPAPTAVAAGCQRTTLAQLENEVMCLVCGVPLALAQAPQADRERAFIRREIGDCKIAAQIKTDLVGQYGPQGIALPEAHGFRLTVYLVPALAALLVAGALAVAIRRRRGPGPVAITGPLPSAREAARLDAELERYR